MKREGHPDPTSLQQGNGRYSLLLTNDLLRQLCGPVFQKVRAVVTRAMKDRNQDGRLSDVILVGGSAQSSGGDFRERLILNPNLHMTEEGKEKAMERVRQIQRAYAEKAKTCQWNSGKHPGQIYYILISCEISKHPQVGSLHWAENIAYTIFCQAGIVQNREREIRL